MGSKRGMTMVEVVVAIGLLILIGGALVSFAVSALSVANTSIIRSAATRLAEQEMERIKGTEQINKVAIQGGDFSSIAANYPVGYNNFTDYPDMNKAEKYFTRTVLVTTSGTPVDTATVTVKVAWVDRGKPANVILTTYITKWL